MKSIKDISWQVDEKTYRADPAISYSTLSTFARGGPKVIPHLADKKEGEGLRFGSLVDCIITNQPLDDSFMIADFPSLSENMLRIIKNLYAEFGDKCPSMADIPDSQILTMLNLEAYSTNWKDETRIKSVGEKGGKYYELLALSKDKTVLSNEDYSLAVSCADVLKSHPFTKEYFNINPFNTEVEKVFQLKFKVDTILYGTVKCMLDLTIVDHKNKLIIPCDIKTTGKNETDFTESFLKYRYDIQASLYKTILTMICAEDDYFKDFTILPFRFIVINRYNQTPIIWIYEEDIEYETKIDKFGNIYKPWNVLIKELQWHLKEQKYDYPQLVYLNHGVMHLTGLTSVL